MVWRLNGILAETAIVAAALSALHVFSQTVQESTPAPADAAPWSATNLSMTPLGAGRYQVGQIRLDPERRSISFPAVLNMQEGIVEYLLVASFGKTHESVLRTEVDPYQIHVAMLLLGARGAGTNQFPEDPAASLPGDAVIIDTSWKDGEKTERRRGEELVNRRETMSPLSRGPWIYNGSYLVDGSFVAQLDGSIVSLMIDPNALVNNPRPGRERDDLWLIRSNGLPELETPITVTIQLLTNRAAAKPGSTNSSAVPSTPRP